MEFLLTLIIVVVLGGWLFRVILGTILRTWLLRKQKQFAAQFETYQRNAQPQRPEGEVKVEKQTDPLDGSAGVSKQVGEYVEFEEEN